MSHKADDIFEVAVIGGGISGLGVALEASRLNKKTVLIEKGSLCGATSANSLRIIHGGLRYLQKLDLSRCVRSRRDQDFLEQWAPECIKALMCLMPLAPSGLRSKPFAALGALTYRTLQRLSGIAPSVCKLVDRRQAEERAPNFSHLFSRGALLWQDAVISDLDGFHQLLKHSCENGGAQIKEGAQVTRITKHSHGYKIEFKSGGEIGAIIARSVVNCAGPWLASLRPEGVETNLEPRWCKAFNLVLRKTLLLEHAVAIPAGKGRMLFLVPRGEHTALGTWYLPFDQSPDGLSLEEREFLPLLQAFNASCPNMHLSPADIDSYECGVLPMVEVRDGEPVLYASEVIRSVGGYQEVLSTKYTTFRSQAQRVMLRASPN